MKYLKKIKALALCAVLAASMGGFVACNNSQEQASQEQSSDAVKVQEIKGDEALKIGEKDGEAIVVDVRSPEEYLAGHIKNAINIPIDNFEKDYAKSLDAYKDKDVVLYCNSGKKSGKAADILVKNGFKKVYNAEGVKQYKYDLVKYHDIEASDLLEMAKDKDAVLVDVRPEKMFKDGHIKGAINVPFDQVDKNLDKLPKDKKILLYCNTGAKSSDVAKELAEKGYQNVYNSVDGVKEYKFDLVKD